MAFLVECDVEGCGAVSRCEEREGEISLPAGWQTVESDVCVPDLGKEIAAKMFPGLASVLTSVLKQATNRLSLHACPAHPMPKWKVRGKALSLEQLETLANSPVFVDPKPPREPPAWVKDVLKEEEK